MALAYDAVSSADFYSDPSGGDITLSWTHTPVGTPDLVIVGTAWREDGDNPTISEITYGGAAMTVVDTQVIAGSCGVSMWKKASPAAGAQTVVVTFTTTGAFDLFRVAGAITFTGADTTTPTGTPAKATGASGDPTVVVTSASGEIVVDVAGIIQSGSDTISVGASQTERVNRSSTSSNDGNPVNARCTEGMSTEAGDTSITMSWTQSDSANDWNIVAVSVKPATTVATSNFFAMFQ